MRIPSGNASCIHFTCNSYLPRFARAWRQSSCLSSRRARRRVEGAVVWFFRYEKSPNCGGFREGYVAIKDGRVLY
jgi:hypothetical protein